MASVYIDLPIRSVGSISAPGLASEATLNDILTEVTSISGSIGQRDTEDLILLDTSSTNITNAAYVQILASTGDAIVAMTVFNGTGRALKMATGGGGSEVDYIYIPPGGYDTVIPVNIAAATRLTLRNLEASTANAGLVVINLFKQV